MVNYFHLFFTIAELTVYQQKSRITCYHGKIKWISNAMKRNFPLFLGLSYIYTWILLLTILVLLWLMFMWCKWVWHFEDHSIYLRGKGQSPRENPLIWSFIYNLHVALSPFPNIISYFSARTNWKKSKRKNREIFNK